MNTKPEKIIAANTELLQCEICLTEIPPSVGQTLEGTDYVHHFCGLECLEKWREQAEKTQNTPS